MKADRLTKPVQNTNQASPSWGRGVGGSGKKLFTFFDVAKKHECAEGSQPWRAGAGRAAPGAQQEAHHLLSSTAALAGEGACVWFLQSDSRACRMLPHLHVPLQMSSSRCRPTRSRLVAADDGCNQPGWFRTGGVFFFVSLFTLRSLLYVFVLLALHLLSSCCHTDDTPAMVRFEHTLWDVLTLGGEGVEGQSVHGQTHQFCTFYGHILVCFCLSS